MNVLDLFSGIGGFSLGLERAGMRTVAFCEIDPYCRRVLAKHWPDVPVYDDVRILTAERLRADGIAVDVICGGFPCQPVSVAGKREASADDRWLWPEYARLIRDISPRYAIIENVPGLLSAGKDRPDMGCLCGWFGRRRRIDLGTEGKDDTAIPSRCYQAGLEGAEYPGGTAPYPRRMFQFGEATGARKTFGDILLEGSGNGSAQCAADDLSFFEDQESAGCDRAALGIDMGDWGQGSIFDLPSTSNIALGTQSNGTRICPACGEQLAIHPGLVGGAAAAEVFNDLAEIGLSVEWAGIPASAVGAPHRRDRVWIIAHATIAGLERRHKPEASREAQSEPSCCGGDVADAASDRWATEGEWPTPRYADRISELLRERSTHWVIEPPVGRLADGVPDRLDRLRALGNAVVPQIPEIIGRAIMHDPR